MSKTLTGNRYSGGSLHFSEISEPSYKDQSEFHQLDYRPRRDMTPRGYSLIQSTLNTSRDHKKYKQTPKIYSQIVLSNSSQNQSRLLTVNCLDSISSKSKASKEVRKERSKSKTGKITRKASVSDPKKRREREAS